MRNVVGALRLKYLLARHGPTLALALVLGGALLVGAAGWASATPETTQVTDRTDVETVRSELHSSARVTGNSTLYENGTRLHDPPVYLLAATPAATLNLTTTVPSDGSVRIAQELTVVYTATRDGETFWQRSQELARTETTTQSGNVTIRARLDPQAIQQRASQFRNEIGTAGSIAVELRFTVVYETNRYEGRFATTVPLTLTDDWYAIDAKSVDRTHGTPVTRTVTVPNQNDALHLGAGLLGGISILLGAGIGGVYYTRLQAIDEASLAHRVHRERYDGWISRGTVPETLDTPTIQTESLEELVDVAIDTRSRVIYDPDRELYVVFTDAATYCFDSDDWWFTGR
jgi:hypothetical protein